MAGIYKAYDIRGVVGKDLTTDIAGRIGDAFARLLQAKRLVVGRDMRTHSPAISDAVVEGMRDAGADVVDIGLASTPMAYHAIASIESDGGLVVTASHNPGHYNGFKLCAKGARPISAANGTLDIERMVAAPRGPRAARRGTLESREMLADYAAHVARFADLARPVKVAIDCANGMEAHTLPAILPRTPAVRASLIYDTLDGTFPNHEANPLKEENLDPVRALVARSGSELGVGFDGDADRCCFVDESGRTVANDLMTALLAPQFLARKPGASVVYDLRSSWVVKEEVRKHGGVAVRDRVGHSFIKATMRGNGAVFGGELSGHYYFADNHVCDSGIIAMMSALNLVSRSSEPLSRLVQGLRRYHSTGEINFHVDDKDAAIAGLKARYKDGRQDELDGITVEHGDLGDKQWWWFNVRASNTEPLLRLNLEASHADLRDQKRDELVALLGEPEA